MMETGPVTTSVESDQRRREGRQKPPARGFSFRDLSHLGLARHTHATKGQSKQRQQHVRCRFKVGKNAQHVRVVDRAFMMVARAFLADVDVIVLNRTEMVFSDEQRRRLYGSLRQCMCYVLCA